MIETERLLLRRWRDDDLATFFAINNDPKVIECLPGPLSENETNALIAKFRAHMAQHGFGLCACVLKTTGELIGFVGLNVPAFEAHFTPCVEIGWRLGSGRWGRGYATEAAQAVLEVGFNTYHLDEIVSFTVPHNVRSRNVMDKLGMTRHEEDDFLHPKLPETHSLCRHVLYRLTKEQFLSKG